MFVRYAKARAERDDREHAYRVYLTETVRLMGQGRAVSVSYEDVLRQMKSGAERIDGDKIAAEVIERAGLNVV